MDLQIYNEIKRKGKLLVCDSCEKEFAQSEIKMERQQIKNEYGKIMDVSFFICPHCKKFYISFISDDRVVMLKEKYDKRLKQLKKMLERGEQPPEEIYKAVENARMMQKGYCEKLLKKYSKFLSLKSK